MEDGTKPLILLKLTVAYTSKINVSPNLRPWFSLKQLNRSDRSSGSGMLQRAGSAAALLGSNHEMSLRAKREFGEKRFMQFAL